MQGPLSFEAAFRNCRRRSHTPPVIVLDCNGIPRKSVENGGIILQHRNCPFTLNVAIKDLQDKPEVKNIIALQTCELAASANLDEPPLGAKGFPKYAGTRTLRSFASPLQFAL
jgi:hypothetical protein